ncbi:hypothetical protein DFH28DRAFT_926168 [Melampsora americana]|nr:hypothetical protein DFH28DRAFT_926168 [Melampsora americana]
MNSILDLFRRYTHACTNEAAKELAAMEAAEDDFCAEKCQYLLEGITNTASQVQRTNDSIGEGLAESNIPYVHCLHAVQSAHFGVGSPHQLGYGLEVDCQCPESGKRKCYIDCIY